MAEKVEITAQQKKGCFGCFGIFAILFIVLVVVALISDIDSSFDASTLDDKNLRIAIGNVIDKDAIISLSSVDGAIEAHLQSESYESADAMISNSTRILEQLQEFKDIDYVSLIWHSEGRDSYGQTSDVEAVHVMMPNESLQKINFDNFYSMDLKKIAVVDIHNGWK